MLLGQLAITVDKTGHPDSNLRDAEAFCASGIRVFERGQRFPFSEQDREALLAFLIFEIWRFSERWPEVRAKYVESYRFVPACSKLVGYRITDGLRLQHGRPGTPRHISTVLSLDAPNPDGKTLADTYVDRTHGSFEDHTISRLTMFNRARSRFNQPARSCQSSSHSLQTKPTTRGEGMSS